MFYFMSQCQKKFLLSENDFFVEQPIYTNRLVRGLWNFLFLLEFESVVTAKKWIDSPEYREARALRHQNASTNMIVVEGL